MDFTSRTVTLVDATDDEESNDKGGILFILAPFTPTSIHGGASTNKTAVLTTKRGIKSWSLYRGGLTD